MFTEEDFEYYEENWNKHKIGRKAISNGREWKLFVNAWDLYDGYQWKDNLKCWKSHRKTHYRIKKVHENKKRKPKEREHWRYNKNVHSYKVIRQEYLRQKNRRDKIRKEKYKHSQKLLDELYTGMYLLINHSCYKVTERFYEWGDSYATIVSAFGGTTDIYINAYDIYKYNDFKIIHYHEAWNYYIRYLGIDF